MPGSSRRSAGFSGQQLPVSGLPIPAGTLDTMDATLAESTEHAFRTLGGLRFSKGHGTGNDFVLVADPEGEHTIAAEQVAAPCATATAASAATA
ncbi:hypothetical protein RKD54_002538 [Pseudarthrobacter sp. SLBN-100]